jgi:hypothetical protein
MTHMLKNNKNITTLTTFLLLIVSMILITAPSAIATNDTITLYTMSLQGRLTQSPSTFTDLIDLNSIGYILGYNAGGTPYGFNWAIDNSIPSHINTTLNKELTTVQTGIANAGGQVIKSNVVYIGHQDQIFQISPANGVFGTHGWGDIYSIVHPSGGTVNFESIGDGGTNKLVLCYAVRSSSPFVGNVSRITLYNIASTTEYPNNLNPAYYDVFLPNHCNAIVQTNTFNGAFVDAQDSIIAIDLTDTTLSSVYEMIVGTSNLYNASGSLYYDDTALQLYRALGTDGVQVLNVNAVNSVSSYAACKPSGTTFTRAVTKLANDVYMGVGTRSSQSIAYVCTLNSTGSITPFREYNITTPNPQVVRYNPTTKMIHIIGNPGGYYDIYFPQTQLYNTTSNTTINETTPPGPTGSSTLIQTVLKQGTNEPISGAAVALTSVLGGTSYQNYTDANGIATITGIVSDTYLKTITKSGYQVHQVSIPGNIFGPGVTVPITSYLTTDVISGDLPGYNDSGSFGVGGCEDTIRGVWLCGMKNTTCTTDAECLSGRCELGPSPRHCSAFNWKLCDAAARPRDNACYFKYTSQGSLKGIANWGLGSFLYVLILLILLFGYLAIRVALKKKK